MISNEDAFNSPLRGSSPRPYAYEAHALPTELRRHVVIHKCWSLHFDRSKQEIGEAFVVSFLCQAVIAQLAARRSHDPKVVSSILTDRRHVLVTCR